jgi:hypothetical protein
VSRVPGAPYGTPAPPRASLSVPPAPAMTSTTLPHRPILALVLALSATLALSACQGTRKLADPVLEIRGAEGTELGVSTDYGLVFLGRTARAGAVEVTAWFGDGPSIEHAVVEPLGGGLYTAEPEIRLPKVPVSFVTPKPGAKLTLVGRRGGDDWKAEVEVRRDPRIDGIVVSVPSGISDREGQIGAGLYSGRIEDGSLRLVGLVSGMIELSGASGESRRYLTVVGPDLLWRLVTHEREHSRRRRFVYREDVM